MSKNEDRIVSVYNKKYDRNMGSFSLFLQEKVEADSFQMDMIKKKAEEFGIQDSFKEDTLRLLIRLIGLTQYNAHLAKKADREAVLQSAHALVFKTSKKKKANYYEEDGEKSEMIPVSEPKEYEDSQKQEQKTATIKESESRVQYEEVEVDDEEAEPFHKNSKSKPKNSNGKSESKKADSQIEKVQKDQEEKQDTKLQKPAAPLKKQKQGQDQQKLSVVEEENSSSIETSTNVLSESSDSTKPEVKYMNFEKEKSLIRIPRFEKYSTDYVNTVIKYMIEFRGHTVMRRYSEFERLMNYLSTTYEGFILPELPPKQGLKGGMSYFRGIDSTFLTERKQKLEEMLNRLLECKFMTGDSVFLRFITDESYEIENNEEGYGSYIKVIADIAFNAKELKDYGIAYCNYLKEKGSVKLNPELERKYEEVEELVRVFLQLNEYRRTINANFDRRRAMMGEEKIKCRKPEDAKFNKEMDLIEDQIKSLHAEYDKYRKLRPRQNWLDELLKQKENDGAKAKKEIEEEQLRLSGRIQKMEKNFSLSLDQFKKSKTAQLQELGLKLIEWRRKVHP